MASDLLGPPLREYFTSDNAYRWFDLFWRKIGGATLNAPINSVNVTGVVASANVAVGAAFNLTNDATCDSTDIDAVNTTVRVYGLGGVGSAWNNYRNKVLLATYAATAFTGKAYATTYYVGYDTVLGTWVIATSYSDVTGDNMIVFVVRTHDANGVVGAASTGGGAPASGSTGGGGRGRLT